MRSPTALLLLSLSLLTWGQFAPDTLWVQWRMGTTANSVRYFSTPPAFPFSEFSLLPRGSSKIDHCRLSTFSFPGSQPPRLYYGPVRTTQLRPAPDGRASSLLLEQRGDHSCILETSHLMISFESERMMEEWRSHVPLLVPMDLPLASVGDSSDSCSVFLWKDIDYPTYVALCSPADQHHRLEARSDCCEILDTPVDSDCICASGDLNITVSGPLQISAVVSALDGDIRIMSGQVKLDDSAQLRASRDIIMDCRSLQSDGASLEAGRYMTMDTQALNTGYTFNFTQSYIQAHTVTMNQRPALWQGFRAKTGLNVVDTEIDAEYWNVNVRSLRATAFEYSTSTLQTLRNVNITAFSEGTSFDQTQRAWALIATFQGPIQFLGPQVLIDVYSENDRNGIRFYDPITFHNSSATIRVNTQKGRGAVMNGVNLSNSALLVEVDACEGMVFNGDMEFSDSNMIVQTRMESCSSPLAIASDTDWTLSDSDVVLQANVSATYFSHLTRDSPLSFSDSSIDVRAGSRLEIGSFFYGVGDLENSRPLSALQIKNTRLRADSLSTIDLHATVDHGAYQDGGLVGVTIDSCSLYDVSVVSSVTSRNSNASSLSGIEVIHSLVQSGSWSGMVESTVTQGQPPLTVISVFNSTVTAVNASSSYDDAGAQVHGVLLNQTILSSTHFVVDINAGSSSVGWITERGSQLDDVEVNSTLSCAGFNCRAIQFDHNQIDYGDLLLDGYVASCARECYGVHMQAFDRGAPERNRTVIIKGMCPDSSVGATIMNVMSSSLQVTGSGGTGIDYGFFSLLDAAEAQRRSWLGQSLILNGEGNIGVSLNRIPYLYSNITGYSLLEGGKGIMITEDLRLSPQPAEHYLHCDATSYIELPETIHINDTLLVCTGPVHRTSPFSTLGNGEIQILASGSLQVTEFNHQGPVIISNGLQVNDLTFSGESLGYLCGSFEVESDFQSDSTLYVQCGVEEECSIEASGIVSFPGVRGGGQSLFISGDQVTAGAGQVGELEFMLQEFVVTCDRVFTLEGSIYANSTQIQAKNVQVSGTIIKAVGSSINIRVDNQIRLISSLYVNTEYARMEGTNLMSDGVAFLRKLDGILSTSFEDATDSTIQLSGTVLFQPEGSYDTVQPRMTSNVTIEPPYEANRTSIATLHLQDSVTVRSLMQTNTSYGQLYVGAITDVTFDFFFDLVLVDGGPLRSTGLIPLYFGDASYKDNVRDRDTGDILQSGTVLQRDDKVFVVNLDEMDGRGVVALNVNSVPVAQEDHIIKNDCPNDTCRVCVHPLENDTDADGDTLVLFNVVIDGGSSNDTVICADLSTANNSIINFSYRASDGYGGFSETTTGSMEVRRDQSCCFVNQTGNYVMDANCECSGDYVVVLGSSGTFDLGSFSVNALGSIVIVAKNVTANGGSLWGGGSISIQSDVEISLRNTDVICNFALSVVAGTNLEVLEESTVQAPVVELAASEGSLRLYRSYFSFDNTGTIRSGQMIHWIGPSDPEFTPPDRPSAQLNLDAPRVILHTVDLSSWNVGVNGSSCVLTNVDMSHQIDLQCHEEGLALSQIVFQDAEVTMEISSTTRTDYLVDLENDIMISHSNVTIDISNPSGTLQAQGHLTTQHSTLSIKTTLIQGTPPAAVPASVLLYGLEWSILNSTVFFNSTSVQSNSTTLFYMNNCSLTSTDSDVHFLVPLRAVHATEGEERGIYLSHSNISTVSGTPLKVESQMGGEYAEAMVFESGNQLHNVHLWTKLSGTDNSTCFTVSGLSNRITDSQLKAEVLAGSGSVGLSLANAEIERSTVILAPSASPRTFSGVLIQDSVLFETSIDFTGDCLSCTAVDVGDGTELRESAVFVFITDCTDLDCTGVRMWGHITYLGVEQIQSQVVGGLHGLVMEGATIDGTISGRVLCTNTSSSCIEIKNSELGMGSITGTHSSAGTFISIHHSNITLEGTSNPTLESDRGTMVVTNSTLRVNAPSKEFRLSSGTSVDMEWSFTTLELVAGAQLSVQCSNASEIYDSSLQLQDGTLHFQQSPVLLHGVQLMSSTRATLQFDDLMTYQDAPGNSFQGLLILGNGMYSFTNVVLGTPGQAQLCGEVYANGGLISLHDLQLTCPSTLKARDQVLLRDVSMDSLEIHTDHLKLIPGGTLNVNTLTLNTTLLSVEASPLETGYHLQTDSSQMYPDSMTLNISTPLTLQSATRIEVNAMVQLPNPDISWVVRAPTVFMRMPPLEGEGALHLDGSYLLLGNITWPQGTILVDQGNLQLDGTLQSLSMAPNTTLNVQTQSLVVTDTLELPAGSLVDILLVSPEVHAYFAHITGHGFRFEIRQQQVLADDEILYPIQSLENLSFLEMTWNNTLLEEGTAIPYANNQARGSYQVKKDAQTFAFTLHRNRAPVPFPDECETQCFSATVCECCIDVIHNDTDPDVNLGFDELTLAGLEGSQASITVDGLVCGTNASPGSFMRTYYVSDGMVQVPGNVTFRFLPPDLSASPTLSRTRTRSSSPTPASSTSASPFPSAVSPSPSSSTSNRATSSISSLATPTPMVSSERSPSRSSSPSPSPVVILLPPVPQPSSLVSPTTSPTSFASVSSAPSATRQSASRSIGPLISPVGPSSSEELDDLVQESQGCQYQQCNRGGGEVSVQDSEDSSIPLVDSLGEQVGQVDVPGGLLEGGSPGSVLSIALVSNVSTTRYRNQVGSVLLDLTIRDDRGVPITQLKESMTICLQESQSYNLDDACLGYYDTQHGIWRCEDTCLQKQDSGLCGKTSHLTSFALLLQGNADGDPCGGSRSYVITWVSVAFIGAALLVVIGFALIIELRIRWRRIQRNSLVRNLSSKD